MKELVRGFATTVKSPRAGAQLPVIRQFVKFSLVGVINTITSITVYELAKLLFQLEPLVANLFAFSAGVTVSYILNKRWTFRNTSANHRQLYTRFFLINVVGLAISETIIYVVHSLAGFHDRVGFAAAVAVVVFWNFNANRAWTFPQPKGVADDGQS
ncbi:MAG: GtrA family protein [Candidatus Kerfeldbacteria bacterium]|nr:GtrA family protein [Candidatus Kerfeldbacteria bacterium]